MWRRFQAMNAVLGRGRAEGDGGGPAAMPSPASPVLSTEDRALFRAGTAALGDASPPVLQ